MTFSDPRAQQLYDEVKALQGCRTEPTDWDRAFRIAYQVVLDKIAWEWREFRVQTPEKGHRTT